MPKFLEEKLRQEYGDNPHAIYGTMNKIGAMRGNQTTAKGREMEAKHNAKVRPMFAGGITLPPPYDPNDPDAPYGMMPPPPQPEESMDPTAPPPMPMPRPPGMLSRFDDTNGDSGEPSSEPSGVPPPPAIEQGGPPPPPDALGRNTMYRRGLIQAQENQDQTAPPPMPGGRIQGNATQQAMDEAKRLAGKKPALWQNILGAALSISPRTRGIDVHPKLSAERQNLGLLEKRAADERALQQAQSNEDIKRDTLKTNAAYRESLLAAKGNPQTKLTGDAQKVALLEEGYKNHPGITPEMARDLALRDFTAKYTKPADVWRKGDIIPDPESSTGYSRKMYNSRTAEWQTEQNVIPGLGYFGTTTETTAPKFVPQANNDIAAVDTTTNVRRTPNIPGRNPLGVPPMAPGAPPASQTPAATPPTTGGSRIVGHRTPAPPQANKPQTLMVPDGKGGFTVHSFGPGDTIPPGAVNAAGVNRASTTAAESGELTTAGQNQMKEVDVVAQQFDDLLRKLEPYKTDNNPLTLSMPMAKYKLGMKSPEGELGNEISNLSLAAIQGMMPFASKSRNYQFIKDIGQHLPHLNVVGGDSPALIYDKLLKARANFEGMRKAISRYEVKHAKAGEATPTGTPATAEEYLKSIGHQ